MLGIIAFSMLTITGFSSERAKALNIQTSVCTVAAPSSSINPVKTAITNMIGIIRRFIDNRATNRNFNKPWKTRLDRIEASIEGEVPNSRLMKAGVDLMALAGDVRDGYIKYKGREAGADERTIKIVAEEMYKHVVEVFKRGT